MASAQRKIVITIARQLGAGGQFLGQRLASRLGYTYLDREILRLAAERAGVSDADLEHSDERISHLWERLIDSLSLGPPDMAYDAGSVVPRIRDARLFEIESRVIHELASRGNVVIIGRGGFWVLRDQPNVVRVFLHSPPEARVAQVQKSFQLSEEAQARVMIDEVDRERERFVQAMTGRAMFDARNYDLAINTQTVTLDSAEDLVVRLVTELQGIVHPIP